MILKKRRSNYRIWWRISAAILAAGALFGSGPVAADVCLSTTTCDLALTQGNGGSGFGTGNFGDVLLTLNTSTHVVTVTITMASGFFLIDTGFPGTAGFTDSLGGGLTIGNFSSAAYSGALSHATNDQHFDGFGFVSDVAATTGPSAGSASAVSALSFDISKGASITDVEQLVNLANPAGGDGPALFIVDAINRNTSGPGAGNTGLIAANGVFIPSLVPEPGTLALLGLGLVGLGFSGRRKPS